MFKEVFTVIRTLISWPPEGEEDVRSWQRSVSIMQWILIGTLSFHLLSTNGVFEPVGISPVASERDVQIIKSQNLHVLYAIYAPQVRALVRQRCDHPSPEMRERINVNLDRVLREYRDATGVPFSPMPSCSEV